MTSSDEEPVTGGHGEDDAVTTTADHLLPLPENDPGGFWARPQGVIAVVGGAIGAVAAIIGLIFVLMPDLQPKPKPEHSGVNLVDSDIDREKNISADVTVDGESRGQLSEQASMLSVALRNTSDDPVLVNYAEARFTSVEKVGCPYGAGGAEIKERYDFKVPPFRRGAFTVTRKMQYKVPPHGLERVGFAVGPERTWEGNLPRIYTFTVVLHLDNGDRLTVPEVTMLAPQSAADTALSAAQSRVGSGEEDPNPYTTPECIRKQAETARKAVAAAKRPSPELREFSADLTRVAQRL